MVKSLRPGVDTDGWKHPRGGLLQLVLMRHPPQLSVKICGGGGGGVRLEGGGHRWRHGPTLGGGGRGGWGASHTKTGPGRPPGETPLCQRVEK